MQIQKYHWLKETSTLVCYAYPALIFVTFRNRDRKASPLLVTNIAQVVYQNELYLHEKIPGRKLLILCLCGQNIAGEGSHCVWFYWMDLVFTAHLKMEWGLYLQDNFLAFPLSSTFSPTQNKPECFTYPPPQCLCVHALWSSPVLQRLFIISLQGFETDFYFRDVSFLFSF